MPTPFLCAFCRRPAQKRFFTVKKLCRHLEISHQHEPHFVITCGINECPRQYNKVSSYRKHLTRKHSNVWREVELQNVDEIDEGEQEGPVEADDDFDIYALFESDNDDNEDQPGEIFSLSRNLALLSLKLREKHVTPAVVTEEVTDTIKNMLVTFVQECAEIPELNNMTEEEKCTAQLQLITNACAQVSSEHMLQKYCCTHFQMVEPNPVDLGNGANHMMQYVPILKTIKLVLSNDDIMAHILQRERHNHRSDTDIMCDYCDGNLYKQHPFLSQPSAGVLKLRLHFYIDEFEVANPLGPKRVKHKQSACYFMIGNIHPKYRSKLENIYLCILVNYKWIQDKVYTYNDVFRQLVEDLNHFENEGFNITYQGRRVLVKGCIATLSADNLSAHDIGGFQKYFHTGRICRHCMTTKNDIPIKTSEEQCLLRTKAVHRYHLNAIQQNPANRDIYGVHGESALTAVHAFNVTDCLPPDVMHDCLEGVFVQTIQVVLAALIRDGEFTLAHLNSSICDFEYGENDSKNKPSSISNPSNGIAGSASQKWCLFRLLPQIIGRNVPLGNDHWQLYLLLREIADVLLAPVIRKSWILPLSNLIAEFIELFQEYVERVSCKVHYLVHYPRLMMLFGPLVHLWCMRFEAKHQYFKQLARVMRNFMNVSSTLATRHQLKQCWEQITKSPLGSLSVQGGSEVNLHSLPADLQRMLTRKVRSMDITFSVNDILWKYTGIVKDNVTFSVNDCFIVELLHGEEIPLFVEIKYIISTRGIYLLCGCVVIPEQFVSHMHAYQVKKTGDWLVFEPGEQLNHHALDIYKDLEVYYIPLRYRVTGPGVT